MQIKPYYQYFLYIMEHKKNVFIECWNEGLYVHAFTHDLSKFLPSEFIPYARYFYIDKEKYKKDFEKAWEKHFMRNKHHWNYWCYDLEGYYKLMIELEDSKMSRPKTMPVRYIMQMICDWKAMSRKFGGTAQEFYIKNYYQMDLSDTTRVIAEMELGIIPHDKYETWRVIGDLVKDGAEINKVLRNTCEKYSLDIEKLLKESKEIKDNA